LPLMFRVGVSMDMLKGAGNSNLILSVDALHPNNDVEYVNVGGEYLFNNMFALRAGYKTLFARDSEEGLSFGAGFKYSIMGRTTVYVDYGYQDFGVLKEVQMFTIGLGF
jgi:predicted porin